MSLMVRNQFVRKMDGQNLLIPLLVCYLSHDFSTDICYVSVFFSPIRLEGWLV